MQADGSHPEPLTSIGAWNDHPSWAPDGRRLVFMATQHGYDDLYILDLASLEQRSLTRTDDYEIEPAWSPDGRLIAFAGPTSVAPGDEIYTIHPDGSHRVRVTPIDQNSKGRPSGVARQQAHRVREGALARPRQRHLHDRPRRVERAEGGRPALGRGRPGLAAELTGISSASSCSATRRTR